MGNNTQAKKIRVEKFKLNLDEVQIQTLEAYLEVCRRTWNMGLALLIEHRDRTWAIRIETEDKPKWICVPRSAWAIKGESAPRATKTNWARNVVNDEEVWAECSYIVAKHRNGGMQDGIRVGACCPIANTTEWAEPRLGMELIGKYTLQYYFTQKNIKEVAPHFAEDFCKVPAWYIRGVCESLSKSWQEYRKADNDRGEPKFKRLSNNLGSLRYSDAKKFKLTPVGEKQISGQCRDAQINIPGIGATTVKWLWHGWGEIPIAVLTIVKKPDAWYLHLTGEFPTEEKERHQKAATKLEVFTDGDILAQDDRGKVYTVLPKSPDGAIDKNNVIADIDRQILELQRQISRQERSCRSRQTKDSNRLKANRLKLAKLHDRKTKILNNSRKKIAHFVAERSASVEIKTTTPRKIPVPEPNIRPHTFVHYDPNGASKVAEINKQKSRLASGEFVSLVKRMTADRGYDTIIEIESKPKGKAKTKKKKSK